MRAKSNHSLLHRLLARIRRPQAEALQKKPVARPFQSVAVFRGNVACKMAHRFGEHRFLVRSAPTLPLPECSMPHKCTCRYIKFNDRRQAEQRRLMDIGFATQIYAAQDRRTRRGRRSGDR